MKAVLFDFDGTLADTMGHCEDIAADVLTKYADIPEDLARKGYQETAGVPFREQANTLVPLEKKMDLHKMIKEYEERKNSLTQTAELFPEVLDIIDHLRFRNVKTGIVSSNSEGFVRNCLKRWSVENMFDWVSGLGIYTDKIQQIKVATLELGCVFKDILYVGDTAHDKDVARKLNIKYYSVWSPDDPQWRRGISMIPMPEPTGA